MPDRTEANPNELNQDDARYGFRCCHLKNIWTAPLPPETELSRQMTSNIGISQSTFSVKVLNLFSRSRRKTNKRKSKHSAMLRNKETRHRMFIGLLNTTRKLA